MNHTLTDEQQEFFEEALGPEVPDVKTAVDACITIVSEQMPRIADDRKRYKDALKSIAECGSSCDKVALLIGLDSIKQTARDALKDRP